VSQNEVQLSPLKMEVLDLKMEVLDCRYVAPFRSYNASKSTAVENRSQISYFLIRCKIRETGGRTS